MTTKTKEQPLPKWFTGMLYTSGGSVTNPFSGESYELTAAELSMYDFIIGCQYVFDQSEVANKKTVNEFHKAITWFQRANPKAYIVLLD